MAYRILARVFGRWRSLAPMLLLVACSDEAADTGVTRSDTGIQTDADASAEPPPLHEVQLLDHKGWDNYPPQLDPLADHQPARLRCGLVGWFLEDGTLEVDTAACNYLLIAHPAAHDVPADSEVELELGHFDLLAPEPASAHVALLFDGDLQWETSVDIPGPGNLQQFRFRTTRDLAAGEPIRLHLHNHGQNTWWVGPVRAWVPEAPH